MVAVQDNQVAIEHRRTAEAVMAEERSRVNRPTKRPVKVISRSKHSVAVEAGRIDKFAISRRGAGGEAIERVFVFQGGGENCPLPKHFAGPPLEAKQQPGLVPGHRVDQKYTVAINDWGCVSKTWQLGPPNYIARGTPV